MLRLLKAAALHVIVALAVARCRCISICQRQVASSCIGCHYHRGCCSTKVHQHVPDATAASVFARRTCACCLSLPSLLLVLCRCISICQGLQLCPHAQGCRQCGCLPYDRHGSHLWTCGSWGGGRPLPSLPHRHYHHPQVPQGPSRRCDVASTFLHHYTHLSINVSCSWVFVLHPRSMPAVSPLLSCGCREPWNVMLRFVWQCTLLCHHHHCIQATQREVQMLYMHTLMVALSHNASNIKTADDGMQIVCVHLYTQSRPDPLSNSVFSLSCVPMET